MHPASSLVPRPFPPPVFGRLQYANTEGEGLGDFGVNDQILEVGMAWELGYPASDDPVTGF